MRNKAKVAKIGGGRVIQTRDPNRATEINLAHFPETWKIPVFGNRLACRFTRTTAQIDLIRSRVSISRIQCHWLCSQSIFFASIFKESAIPGCDQNNAGAAYNSEELHTLGYSPQAIFVLTLLVMLMCAMLFYFGTRRFATRIPLSGSCSAVISAMCHQPATEVGDEGVLKPLMWGVSFEEVQDGVYVVECSFSSRETRQPDDYEAALTWGMYTRTKLG